MDRIEKLITEYTRKGQLDKANFLKNLDKVLLPSTIQRIQQNDKTVLKEIVLPKWVDWELLYEWANSKKIKNGRTCILCNESSETGIDFKSKFICDNCFLRLKNLNQ
ncbi:MAG: sigma factor G inhibitor Gin [Candidatus Diapherotrites archaeon]|nr:sigma factor G inhibitor Gin [Candidatus Diapherotrites archaeon]